MESPHVKVSIAADTKTTHMSGTPYQVVLCAELLDPRGLCVCSVWAGWKQGLHSAIFTHGLLNRLEAAVMVFMEDWMRMWFLLPLSPEMDGFGVTL